MTARLALAAGAGLLAACAGGSGGLQGDAALAASTYVELDLATGQVTALDAQSVDLGAPRWRDAAMLFHRIRAGDRAVSGAALGGARLAVDADATVPADACWVGVFEVTVAQWRRIAGSATDPELATVPPGLASGSADHPVTGIAAQDARLALAALRIDGFRLRLPSSGEWVAACSDGNGRLFAWGNGSDAAVTATYAVCLAGDGSTPGLQAVGSRAPTATGFCDMHGNAWEIVANDGAYAIRGGAWDVPALHCRTSNRIAIPADLPHPTVGLRVVLAP